MGIGSLLGNYDSNAFERQYYLNQLNAVDPARMYANGYNAAMREFHSVEREILKPNKKLLLLV